MQGLSYNHEGAKQTLGRLLEIDPEFGPAWDQLGDICLITGSLSEALTHYRSAAEAARRSGDLRDLAISYEKIGDVLVRQGNLLEALGDYHAGLAIAELLSNLDAADLDCQRDLSASYSRIGQALTRQGNLGRGATFPLCELHNRRASRAC